MSRKRCRDQEEYVHNLVMPATRIPWRPHPRLACDVRQSEHHMNNVVSPHLFNIYAGKIVRKTTENFESSIIGGRNVLNLRSTDGVVLLARSI